MENSVLNVLRFASEKRDLINKVRDKRVLCFSLLTKTYNEELKFFEQMLLEIELLLEICDTTEEKERLRLNEDRKKCNAKCYKFLTETLLNEKVEKLNKEIENLWVEVETCSKKIIAETSSSRANS